MLKRTNRHILSNSGGKQLDMLTQPGELFFLTPSGFPYYTMTSSAPSDVPIGRLTLQQAVGEVVRDMKYLHHREGGSSGGTGWVWPSVSCTLWPGEFVTKLETLWVLADVGSEQGRNTLLTALRFLVMIMRFSGY